MIIIFYFIKILEYFNKMIVKGYKGVMDLDLSLVPKEYHKTAVDQHYKDIRDYKIYQASLKPQHRYENTILRIKKQLEYAAYLENKNRLKEQNRRYELCNKIYKISEK